MEIFIKACKNASQKYKDKFDKTCQYKESFTYFICRHRVPIKYVYAFELVNKSE